MSKQEVPQSSLADSGGGSTTREGRYYVQVLTEHIFLVRECQSTTGKPGPDDSIVRSFDVRFDAYHYANSMNE
jgi:hypothetical protein